MNYLYILASSISPFCPNSAAFFLYSNPAFAPCLGKICYILRKIFFLLIPAKRPVFATFGRSTTENSDYEIILQ